MSDGRRFGYSSVLGLSFLFVVVMTALNVVTDATLWIHINSFVSGLPVWTIDYARRRQSGNVIVHVASAVKSLAQQDGDARTLQRLHYLQAQPEYQLAPKVIYHSAMHYAAAHGRLDRVKWLHANTTEQCRYDTMAVAARNGHGDVVRWLQHNRPESHKSMTHRIMDFAASRGFLEVVQVLHEERKEGCTTIAMDGAAGIGHLQVVQYLHAHRKEGCTPAAFDTAAANGHLAVVEWLHEYRSESGTKAASFGAAVNGHVEVVRFLLNHRDSGYVDEGIRLAIPNLLVKGDSVVLPLLLTDCPELFPLFSMAMAAENGHLDVIKLLHPTRPREDIEEALVRGAKNYPAIVDYLLENDKFSTPVLKSAVDRARTLAVSVKLHQHILPEANTVNVFGLAPSPKPCSRARRKAKKPMLLARRQQFACT